VLRYLPTFRQLVFWVGLAVLTAGIPYGVLAYRFWNNPPKLSRNIAAELNAPVLAIPDDQKAWPIYRDVLMALAKDSPQEWRDDHRTHFLSFLHEPAVIEFIRRHDADWRKVRVAAKLPSLGYLLADRHNLEDARFMRRFQKSHDWQWKEELKVERPRENPDMMAVLLVPAGEIGELFDALAVDAVDAARNNDGARAVADLETMFRVAEHVREIPIVVNDLASLRHYARTLWIWGGILSTSPTLFDNRQLMRLENVALSYAAGDLTPRFESEASSFEDLLQRLYTDDGAGDGYFYLPNLPMVQGNHPDDSWYTTLIAPLSKRNIAGRRTTAEEFAKLHAAFEQEIARPYWECRCSDYERLRESYRDNKPLSLVWMMGMPATSTHAVVRDALQQRNTLLVASAIIRFLNDHGRFPTNSAELVPKYLDQMPLDELSGKPLQYELKDSSPTLYSVGFDKVDDGGRPAMVTERRVREHEVLPWEWSFAKHRDEQLVGDLILWPYNFERIELPPPPDPYVP
jgi:hypothetical protein